MRLGGSKCLSTCEHLRPIIFLESSGRVAYTKTHPYHVGPFPRSPYSTKVLLVYYVRYIHPIAFIYVMLGGLLSHISLLASIQLS